VILGVGGKATATANFSTAAAQDAAFGRNDRVWVVGGEQTTATATADFSTAAAQDAAFGRNDGVWVLEERTSKCSGSSKD
jgi:hypothetical protein